MDVPALIREAQRALGDIDQAAFARRIRVSEPTVSKWKKGTGRPDYESCLRIAKETGWPAPEVLQKVGLDPNLLPPAPNPREFGEIERDILERAREIQEIVSATEDIPPNFWQAYLTKVLDRTQDEIGDILRMISGERARRVTTRKPRAVTRPNSERNGQLPGDPDSLTKREPARPSQLIYAAAGAL